MAVVPEKALFAGLHFDRAKYGRDMDLFHKKSKVVEAPLASAPSKLLDFFGDSAKSRKPGKEETTIRDTTEMDKSRSSRKRERILKNVQSTEITEQPPSTKRSKVDKKRSNGDKQDVEVEDVSIFKPKKAAVTNKPVNKEQQKVEAARVEADALLRKKYKIHVSGQRVPAPMNSFEDLTKLGCKSYLFMNLVNSGYTEPTPIQRQAIPVLLSGRECFACAPTGSGKTMAFLIPILMSLKVPSTHGIRAVILCPTRELALQTARELKKIIKGSKLKARLMTKATANTIGFSAAPCDILISTPLRLDHSVTKEKVDLTRVQHLVLDEADKLFEMGFVEQIDVVIAACSNPKVIRTLFSATLPENVEELARTVMQDPVRIVIGERNAAAETVDQKLMFVGSEEGKLLAVRQMFQEGLQPPVLIFVQSKERAKQLYKELAFEGINVDVIHADRTQAQRETVVDNFRAGRIWVLIATDVMARGMDFKGVACVVNYDLPQNTASYIHRIGRSGRAGRAGKAISLYTESDKSMLRSIANVMVASGCEAPPWMLALPKQRIRGKDKLRVPRRKDISTMPKIDAMKIRRKREMIEASKRRKLAKQNVEE